MNLIPSLIAESVINGIEPQEKKIMSQETTEIQHKEYNLSEENSINGQPPRRHFVLLRF